MESMMADINREVQERTSASLRLKVGLLSYFCNNMRRRCRQEVVNRSASGLIQPSTPCLPAAPNTLPYRSTQAPHHQCGTVCLTGNVTGDFVLIVIHSLSFACTLRPASLSGH